ncbi:hypothetical protein KC957_03590 [Candidatus Saccharibacteria bacterium]|nr:hypothetical protein [Candidatus Saccharibacteria bacterium]
MSNTTTRERWVSFPDATEATEGLITVGYAGLPNGLDPDRLQVNATALERGVIGWGGYSALTLAAYKGDEDHYSMGVGTDSGGNAYGVGAATVSKAESSSIRPASDGEFNALDIRNGSLGIQWNINALNSRIETHEQFDPTVRARQISREIRKGAVRGILQHNISDVLSDKPRLLSAFEMGFDGLFLAGVGGELLQRDYAGASFRIVNRAMILGGVIRGFRTLYNKGVPFKDQIIDPLFWTARPTRGVIGAGVIATSRLVRPTPLSNN